ncbi:hypothetical protein AgCh_034128 [Apium graveolens]
MKDTPDASRCGFSSKVVNALNKEDVCVAISAVPTGAPTDFPSYQDGKTRNFNLINGGVAATNPNEVVVVLAHLNDSQLQVTKGCRPADVIADPDIEQVRKDKKAMNILFNGVDGDMFDNIINYKTTKEQYEHFHFEESESLIDIFSRFKKLLYDLKLHGRVYQTKDSNLKFLRSLPNEWKPMTISLRNSQDYKEFTLERLYGILKTYELEIEQDERMEKERKKGGSIALVAELENEKEIMVKSVESTSKVCKSKGKGLVAENEDQLSQGDMDDIDEHLAFLSRRFSKLKFKKNFGATEPNRNMVDKSKFKCFKCGLACHFVSECRKSDSSKKKFELVDYK